VSAPPEAGAGPAGAVPAIAYATEWLPEDAALAAARARAAEMGVAAVGPLAGASLRFLAAVTQARAVVELGTGTGVSGLWLLRGMPEGGVLTSIDVEAEHQRLAREVFTEAGVPANRLRLIAGSANDVLPRLADASYDLVHADARSEDVPDLLDGIVRIVRPGGVLVIGHALAGKVADPTSRDAAALALRVAARAVRERDDLLPVLWPVDDGLLAAVRMV
jgi:predicted O-methyltransferase YrrM